MKNINNNLNQKALLIYINVDSLNKAEKLENSLEELGDLLFSIINLSRHLEIDASEAINQANHKFVKRFRLMEKEIAKDKKELDNLSPEELEEFWVRIKLHG